MQGERKGQELPALSVLTLVDDNFLQFQTGIPAASEINGPVTAEHQQITAAVILQKFCITTQVQIREFSLILINEANLFIRQHLHPQVHAILTLHAVLENIQLQGADQCYLFMAQN